jgi:hypothetical protein
VSLKQENLALRKELEELAKDVYDVAIRIAIVNMFYPQKQRDQINGCFTALIDKIETARGKYDTRSTKDSN